MRASTIPLVLSATIIATAACAFPIETTTGLNLRSGPSGAHPVTATMPRGEIVHLDFCQGTWCRVLFRDTTGWASAEHLARIPGRPFPWEGAERAARAYPFDRPARPAAGPPGDVLRSPAPHVDPHVAPHVDPPAAVQADAVAEPERPASRRAALDPVPLPPAAPRAISGKAKPGAAPPEPGEARSDARPDVLARDRDANGAADPLRRIGPRGAGGRDVL